MPTVARISRAGGYSVFPASWSGCAVGLSILMKRRRHSRRSMLALLGLASYRLYGSSEIEQLLVQWDVGQTGCTLPVLLPTLATVEILASMSLSTY